LSRAASALLAGALLAACGGGAGPEREVQTTLLVSVDGLPAELFLGADGAWRDLLPGLAQLLTDDAQLSPLRSSAVGTNAALGVLLTGRSAADQGLWSVRALGRHALPSDTQTLAEELSKEGWSTLAAVSLRQLGGAISGLDQGFASWTDGHVPEDGGSARAAQTLAALRPRLQAALESEQPVFGLLHLGDLRAAGQRAPAGCEELLRERLDPLRGQVEGLAAVLDAEHEDEQALVLALRQQIGRRRDSVEREHLERALRDAICVEMDGVFADLHALLRASGRLKHARVLILGIGRGAAEPGASPSQELARPQAPLLVRAPEGLWPGGSEEVVSISDLFGALRGAAPSELAMDARPEAGADDGLPGEVQRSLGIELRPGGGRPVGVVVRGSELELAEDPGWSSEERPRVLRDGERVLGQLPASGARMTVREPRGRAPFVVELRAPSGALGEAAVRVGARSLDASFLPRLPDPRGAEWEPDREPGSAPHWDVDVLRASGGALELRVGEESPGLDCRVLLTRFPEDPLAELQLEALTGGSLQGVEGRLDACWLEGETPLSVRMRLGGGARPALAVQLAGVQVPIARMRYLGCRYTRDALLLCVPSWIKAVSDDLYSPTGADPGRSAPGGSVVLWHPGAWDPSQDRGLSPDQLRFVLRLPRGE